MLSCHQPAPSLPAHIGFCPKFRAALLSQAPGTPHWLPLAGGPELWGETPGAQVGGVATARGALLGSGGASGTPRDQQPSWGSPSRCFAVPGGCARGCGCEKGEVKVRSERRLPPRQGGYPAQHPQHSGLFRDGWGDEAGGNVALPPPPSPSPPHPKPPQAHPEPLPPHIWAPALRAPPAFCSPPSPANQARLLPSLLPGAFPASSPLIGHDASPSAPQNNPTRSGLPNRGVPPRFVYPRPSLGRGGRRNPSALSFPGSVRPVGSHLRGEEPPPVTGGVERTGSR